MEEKGTGHVRLTPEEEEAAVTQARQDFKKRLKEEREEPENRAPKRLKVETNKNIIKVVNMKVKEMDEKEPETNKGPIDEKKKKLRNSDIRRFLTGHRRCGTGQNRTGGDTGGIRARLDQFRYVPYKERPEVIKERIRSKLARFRYTPRESVPQDQSQKESSPTPNQAYRPNDDHERAKTPPIARESSPANSDDLDHDKRRIQSEVQESSSRSDEVNDDTKCEERKEKIELKKSTRNKWKTRKSILQMKRKKKMIMMIRGDEDEDTQTQNREEDEDTQTKCDDEDEDKIKMTKLHTYTEAEEDQHLLRDDFHQSSRDTLRNNSICSGGIRKDRELLPTEMPSDKSVGHKIWVVDNFLSKQTEWQIMGSREVIYTKLAGCDETNYHQN